MVIGSHKRMLTIAAALMLILILFASSHTVFAYGTEKPTSAPAHHGLAPHTSDSEHTECPQSIHQIGISRLSGDTDTTAPIAAQIADTVCVRDISINSFHIPILETRSGFSEHPLDQKVVLRL